MSVGSPRHVGNYQVVRTLDPAGSLGDNAFLAVRRGARPGDGEPLRVLKVYNGDATARSQMLLQLPRLHRLRHPATTRVLECFDDKQQLVLVFEHHDGLSLAQIQEYLDRENERLADAAIWFIAHQLLGALAEAHASADERGQPAPIVHGRLSPGTVHVDWDGTIRMIGLGIAPLVPISEPGYSAPQEVRAQGGDVAADVYSVAIILWSLLSGRQPMPPLQALDAQRGDVPGVVAEAIEQVLHPQPGRRPIGCRDMQERLEESKKVVSEPAELRWNMELLRASSLFSQSNPGAHSIAADSTPASSSLPPLESLADESTSEGATLVVTRQHYMRGPSDSQAFFDPETTLPPEGNEQTPLAQKARSFDEEETLIAAAPPLIAPPPLPAPTVDAPRTRTTTQPMGPPVAATQPMGPPVAAPTPLPQMPPPVVLQAMAAVAAPPARPDASRLAVTIMSGRAPQIPASQSKPSRALPLATFAAFAVFLAGASFAAGWLLKPPAAPATSEPSAPIAQEPTRPPPPPPPSIATPSPPPNDDGFPPIREDKGGPPLGAMEGYLVVRSPVDAFVYVQGVQRGRTNEKLKSACDTRFIRLRDATTHEWLGDGQPVAILCGATTTVTVRP